MSEDHKRANTASRASRRQWNPWRPRASAIAEHIEAGVFLEPACILEGVSPETVRDAIDREDPDADPIVIARAAVEARLSRAAVSLAADGTPVTTGPLAVLERLAPKRWHLPSRVEVSGPDGAPAQSEVKITLADAVAGARGEGER